MVRLGFHGVNCLARSSHHHSESGTGAWLPGGPYSLWLEGDGSPRSLAPPRIARGRIVLAIIARSAAGNRS